MVLFLGQVMKLKKDAFTMLEFVIIIVVVGILAAIMIPRLNNSDTALYNAARQIVSHIRYTQHLALIDDKIDTVTNWYIARWQIYFASDSSGSGDKIYTIYSDIDRDDATNPDTDEIAIEPVSRKKMTGDSMYGEHIRHMNLTTTYGITNIEFDNGCSGVQRLFFDHLGRPLLNNNSAYDDLMTLECHIKLIHNSGKNIIIKIQPETGYACVYDAAANICR